MTKHPPFKEGSREHVIWWDGHGRHCTCPYCEVNQQNDEEIEEIRPVNLPKGAGRGYPVCPWKEEA